MFTWNGCFKNKKKRKNKVACYIYQKNMFIVWIKIRWKQANAIEWNRSSTKLKYYAPWRAFTFCKSIFVKISKYFLSLKVAILYRKRNLMISIICQFLRTIDISAAFIDTMKAIMNSIPNGRNLLWKNHVFSLGF